ncbi:ABC transporter permease [Spirochaeta africana]|uniref:ABC-type transport system, involved in lipoprotein release, permease component n=1 Tax=Spirochaeta africana (strain ATCC 700263 / DSM 8902 / Z-7692) TaxID=889378 RepID=H9UFI8_SPIAZ|nr:FtsX-like permease family protein [Spirochaeta africana]AFG36281.1 ABC-type transport system, involved in lipoprotein release, permease component [Spirochaeta africana DSM 8902]
MKPQLFRMAARNLLRHRRRTIITAVALAAGVSIYIAIDSVMAGFTGMADMNLQEFEMGSAGIFAEGYWDEREQYPLDLLIEEPEAIMQEMDRRGIPAAPRIAFRGELIVHYDPFPEDGSVPMSFIAIDPARDAEVFRLADTMQEGRFPESGEEIIIGRWLADRLGAEVGFPVSVTTRTRDGYRQLLDLEIVGIYNSANPQTDRHTVFVPLGLADEYLEMRGAVTGVYLALPEHLPGTADLEPARTALADTGLQQRLELLGFLDMTADFLEIEEMKDAATGIIMFLLATIAIVGISNTMLMSVLERQKEIGMMRSLGFRNREIRRIFMYEAAGIGTIGAAFGLLLGAVFVWLLTSYGIDYGVLLEDVDLSAYRFEGVLYGVWDVGSMLTVSLFAIVTSGIVAALPTRRVLRKSITECLRQ